MIIFQVKYACYHSSCVYLVLRVSLFGVVKDHSNINSIRRVIFVHYIMKYLNKNIINNKIMFLQTEMTHEKALQRWHHSHLFHVM